MAITPAPRSLRIWFLAHFLVDYGFAIPLFLFPARTLAALGWSATDPLAARLVAAALFAIGGTSFTAVGASRETYRHLLTLKIIWSAAALIGFGLAIASGIRSAGLWLAVALFALFGIVWAYYYLTFASAGEEEGLGGTGR